MSTSSPDPGKPNCPYLPGFEVDISTHTAPLPFGGGMYPLGSEEYRLEVLAILLDGIAKQCHAGVDQRGLSPRNVIITPPPKLKEKRPQRVVLIDYNISTVYELTEYGKRTIQLAKLPPNPMELFWTASLSDLAGWVPPGLCYDRRLQQEWLQSEFGGEKKVLYEPLENELELHETPPEDYPIWPLVVRPITVIINDNDWTRADNYHDRRPNKFDIDPAIYLDAKLITKSNQAISS
ncbi:hypothetical protein J7T55_000203 [Diaporthe amygdali]|uniref:uncharacterized protein n=1 Tax=Phomopsis amygdali TaxID=1214568 RepID=UPI0022FF1651|nr:uncharacterized protein J7T55_000203 [Diaporthe amygdali]KAJ0108238.1 hypothetical protein J7T55_000203 [Diaporthe amygdali]